MAAVLTVVGILGVAEIDFASGVELRVYPLYYLPLSFAAWYVGRTWTFGAAVLCTAGWAGSNYLAGLRYSGPGIWMFNGAMHGVSFLAVGLLLAQLKVALLRAKRLSRLDPLTSLLNGRAFEEEAARILSAARRRKRPLTVAYIDLDDFKKVNDTYGHHVGDELLCAIAAAVRGSIRSSDLGARMGGDEFVVLLPETGPNEAGVALERLRGRLAEAVAGSPRPVTATIGGVVFRTLPESVEAMVRAADARMYDAKAAGKDRMVLDVAEGPAG
jgi:diguanylate cyclase (GGDEF)-like protein